VAMAIAKRYARALADVVGRTGDYQKTLGELEGFAAAYQESAELRAVLTTPAVPLPEKIKVLDAIVARLEVAPVTANFLRVLTSNYRLGLLGEAIQAYLRIVNERLGIARVQISSAAELSDAERGTLLERFEALTRQHVEVEFRIEKELLGGVVARIESTVYDGSVRGHLERLRERFTAR